MKNVVLASLTVAALAVLVPTAALAKGASEGEIAGPGLSGPISLGGSGEPGGGGALGEIADAAGFFQAVFAQTPDPMRATRPAGDLGPRYTITYVMPGPSGAEDRIQQDVYPYARPYPVTYTKPGQRFWSTNETRGGWFVAMPSLKDLLVGAGLPPNAPVTEGAGGVSLVAGLSVVGAAVAIGVAGAVLVLRRPSTPVAG